MGIELRGIAITYEVTSKYIDRLSNNSTWYDETRSRSENKYEMKNFGSAVMGMKNFLKEMTILSLAKVIEDLRYDARKLFGLKLDFWSDYTPPIPYHTELKKMYHLSNVIKHNRGLIERKSSESSKYLVDVEGFENGEPMIYSDIDYRSLIFYCDYALADIIGRITGLEHHNFPDDLNQSINDFYNDIVPESFNDISE